MPSPRQTVARMLEVHAQGSTFPALVETETGERYILKFRGAGPGSRALLAELIVNSVAPLLGVRVPAPLPLYLPHGFPWQVGTDEFDDMLQASFGWNLGIEWIPEARVVPRDEVSGLSEEFLAGVATLDRLFQNVDRTTLNPNILRDAKGELWAIDHGTCLVFERIVSGRATKPFTLPPSHFLSTRIDLDEAIDYPYTDIASCIAATVAKAPADWLEALPIDSAALVHKLTDHVREFKESAIRSD